ncbi:regulator of chromosome condensation 1/beta-lactamase-inhibitor protein II [Elsinoe ampelina]|uniref:Regulator of chromosome condensation 1/beta-lactamase-inhibitor protein II n=1 Tax=Elsinoe ampelina TaxID=302913 RepID=A0A6A6GJ32_9PEZI|nr:regulator of chromosome condensation 1/beta-lactamase-inhibitor protein II [Elsinoe ampelina]
MKVFALGSNGSGQLGLGHDQDCNTPCQLTLPPPLENDEIVNIVSGGNHTLFLTRSGAVYATGDNEVGPLGVLPMSGYQTLVRLDLPPIKLCAAVWSASIFVTVDDRVLTCGLGCRGGWSLDSTIQSVYGDSSAMYTPFTVPDFPAPGVQIVDISASMGHVVVVLSNGAVYGWGNGRHGQLGAPHEEVPSPRRINEVSFTVTKVVCGKSFTCFFSTPERGEAMMLGHSKLDRFGLKTTFPPQVTRWHQVSASWGSLLVLSRDGKLQGFGRNDRGQLGPADLTSISQISAGTEHALALTADGKVLAWGWGEHGNVGEPVDDQKDAKGRCNTLDVPGSVNLIHAGCATSFIVAD